jgi:hypothetical protein
LANNINQQKNKRYGHLQELNQGENIMGLDITGTKKSLSAKITYHF